MEYEIGANERVSTAVVHAVSAVDGRNPRSLPPLAHVLDPEAMDALFAARHDGDPRTGGRLSFVYETCRVSVESGEYLTVHPLENHPRVTDVREPGHARVR